MQNKFIVVFVLFLMTLAQLGTDIYLPSFPAIKDELLTTNSLVQQTFSIFFIGFAVSQLIYGPLSDRYGRKPFLYVGVLLYLSMSLIAACSQSIELLLLARFVQGVGAGGCSVVPRAIMRDIFSGKALQKMSLYQSMVWSMIPITAPLLGSYIQDFLGWRYNFIVLVIISIIALIMVVKFEESHLDRDESLRIKSIASAYKIIITDFRFISYLICAMGVVGCFTAFNVSAPLLMQETLKMTPVEYGWAVFFIAVIFLIGTFINKSLMQYYEDSRIALAGASLMFLSVVILMLCNLYKEFTLSMLLGPMIILQIGSALVFPSNAAKAVEIFPKMAGKASALFGCFAFFGGALTSTIMAMLPETSLLPLSSVMFVIAATVLYFQFRVMAYE